MDSPPFAMELHSGELDSASDQHIHNCFFNPTWDQTALFDSALSSIVSSPAASNAGEAVMLRELIGKLGTISDSGHTSPESYTGGAHNSTAAPLSYPPKPKNLSVAGTHFPVDPGFAERVARFSSFAAMGIDSGKLSGVSANQPLQVAKVSSSEFGDSREGSSLSDQIPAGARSQNRKRKPKATGKDLKVASENEDPEAKKMKQEKVKEEANESSEKGGEKTQKHNKNSNSNPQEPPKDYIHVRARRGQATDSHSLAERVRREKISERMKFLQDLVPGCSKVSGKAVMLDEIINYVQSLQRQVEFLSMKLSTVNPKMDFNMEALLSKETLQSLGSLQQVMYPVNSSATAFPYGYGSDMPLPSMNGFGEVAPPQVSGFWEDDLQSLVHTGFGPNSQDFDGQMKVEI